MKAKKYLYIIIFSLIICSLSSCSGKIIVPKLKKNEDTLIKQKLAKNPQNYDPKVTIFYSLSTLNKQTRYIKENNINILTYKNNIPFEEKITSNFYKNNKETYYHIEGSSLINFSHSTYYDGNNKIAYKDDNNTIKCSNIEEYKNVYGFSNDKLLSSLIMNQESIIAAQMVQNNKAKDEYTYLVSFDMDKAGYLLNKQINFFGELNNTIDFTYTGEMVLKINKNYLPLSYEFKTKFRVNDDPFSSLTFELKSKVNFIYNKEINKLDYKDLKAKINEQVEKVEKSKNVSSSVFLKEIIASYLKSNFSSGINLEGNITINKSPINVTADIFYNPLISNTKKALKFDITFNFKGYPVNIIYEESIFYMSIPNMKFKWEIEDENKKNAYQKNDTKLNILDYINIKKLDGSEKGYIIKPKRIFTSILLECLTKLGFKNLILEDDLDCYLTIKLTNEKISALSSKIQLKEYELASYFNLTSKKYETKDLSGYEQIVNIHRSLDPKKYNLESIFQNPIDIYLDIRKNEGKLNVNLKLKFSFSNEIKEKINSLANETLNDLLLDIKDSKYIIIKIENNKLYLILEDENGNMIYQNSLKNSLYNFFSIAKLKAKSQKTIIQNEMSDCFKSKTFH